MKSLLLLPLIAFISTPDGRAQCQNDNLGNTSFATAIPLAQGSLEFQDMVVVGIGQPIYSVPDEGNDLYSLTLADGASIQVDVDFDTSESFLYGQILSGDTFVTITGSDPNTGEISINYENTTGAPRDIVVRIASALAPAGCGTYDLKALVDWCPSDDLLEPNDDCNTPTFFGIPSSSGIAGLQRLASQQGNDDWLAVDVPAGSMINASILFEHANADLDLQLYGPGPCGAIIQTSQSTTDNESVTWTNDTNAMVTVGLRAYFFGSAAGNTCCNYAFEFDVTSGPDDQFEENDSICDAAGAPIGVYSDLLVYDADSDFFKLASPLGSRVKFAIDFDHSAGDLDLRLWDITFGCDSPVLVDQSTSVSNYEEVSASNANITLAEFAVEVLYYPTDGGSNSYSLTVALGDLPDLGEQVCQGVTNSTGLGAETFAIGSVSVASNNVLLQTKDLPANAFGFYVTSAGFGVVNNPGGSSGNLCIAGAPTGRYVGPGQIQSSGSLGQFQLAIDLNNIPQPNGTVSVAPGDTWFFQSWYRDSSQSGPTSNFSGAIRIRFL